MWRRIPVPGFCERMIGFSVPKHDAVLVLSYEGMHLLRLGPPVTVSQVADPEYDPDHAHVGLGRYCGEDWEIIGLHGGEPLLASPQGEWLELDDQANTVSVLAGGTEVWASPFENFSGDWAAATFSPDGLFIVLGCPYDFDFRVWQRGGGAAGE
jgi:hypothetical protein